MLKPDVPRDPWLQCEMHFVSELRSHQGEHSIKLFIMCHADVFICRTFETSEACVQLCVCVMNIANPSSYRFRFLTLLMFVMSRPRMLESSLHGRLCCSPPLLHPVAPCGPCRCGPWCQQAGRSSIGASHLPICPSCYNKP